MVTVRKLISELKKMPQNLPVSVAMHDNNPNEVAGHVSTAFVGSDNFDPEHKIKCVILQCY